MSDLTWRERLRFVRHETGCGLTDCSRALRMTTSNYDAVRLLDKYLVDYGCACMGCVYLPPDGERMCRGRFLAHAEFERMWQEHAGLPVDPKPVFCPHRILLPGTSDGWDYTCEALVWPDGRCSRGHIYVDLLNVAKTQHSGADRLMW